ncbi:hypothetical protein T12_11709 [Trichinella patagoniensis]|uniref:Uncharacterized protein n=1 Tax=Trichinella patagoniensis TaxID=990121 RepID=A0A0V0ZEK3_9BILA|nr:hypothetical protein T12_14900 [Trichinella patagoniensis]KRY11099.1 hypothetical protein T12_11252 [Trichinella patagoniensis]KRY17841.1 hypothetical protein T12_4795 [Trichinella patagoniensis]KRY22646.1 hypothetical protein T12_11709 [Trichinella patagoniensis]
MAKKMFHIDKEKLSRELCDRETRGYVFCTPLLVTDRLMLIKSIFEEKNFFRKFQNFMGYRLAFIAEIGEKFVFKISTFLIVIIVVWRFSTEPPQYFWSKRALKFTFCQF